MFTEKVADMKLSLTATISITWSTAVCITSTAIIAMTTARWKLLHNSDR